jgi:hypothetical protein
VGETFAPVTPELAERVTTWPVTARQATNGATSTMLGNTQAPVKRHGMPEPLGIKRIFTALDSEAHDQQAHSDNLLAIARQIRAGTTSVKIRRAAIEDLDVIRGLIDEAKAWLPSKKTDQWSTDWLDKDGRGRDGRVEISIKEGTTWLVWLVSDRGKVAVATVTIEENANPGVWPEPQLADKPAVYLSRLVTARRFSGLRIGAALITLACKYAACQYGAKFLRIDVWTGNSALHDYYLDQGFRFCGLCPDEGYPSRARFQRPTSGGSGW